MIRNLTIYNNTHLKLTSHIAQIEAIMRGEEQGKIFSNKIIKRHLYCKTYQYELIYLEYGAQDVKLILTINKEETE
jgi:hypothetical protein